MPHKHKRKHGEGDAASFNLPPTAHATSLPVNKPKAVVVDGDPESKRSNKRRKPNKPKSAETQKMVDDTPKQFARLMAFQQGKKLRKGLDDGNGGSAQRKEKKTKSRDKLPASASESASAEDVVASAHTSESQIEEAGREEGRVQQQMKILPGERLSDFALRVDQSLPLSQVPKHSTKSTQVVPGLKEKTYLTKHNKRLAKMQTQWREDDKRFKEKREEELEELDDKKEEEGLLWMGVDEARKGKKGKKAKREGDIWRVLERRRKEAGTFGDRGGGLNAGTAVQAPPVLKGLKNMFKERGEVRSGPVAA
ncbi:uncharacterized protein HMPREF1541_04234 [Cyphellophora europaea CBS 101466]|uniref:Uncharacterized protein n=1 Tax=Cyphellophora europaea (strain CBS 101466) TaxID=1220924 RepID=W2S2L3_CYPE1|nr:uncharacterized protein HMPREF1541_04234 [Cyphellophora europaea CBS 101466]ETN42293.1 hypothetical protein HMPREF1541_04234 [Cyphellophora europaea CBS 101466]